MDRIAALFLAFSLSRAHTSAFSPVSSLLPFLPIHVCSPSLKTHSGIRDRERLHLQGSQIIELVYVQRGTTVLAFGLYF